MYRNNLRKLMIYLDLTNTKLAKMSGMTKNSIRAIACNERIPTRDEANKISEMLGYNKEEIFPYDGVRLPWYPHEKLNSR